MGSGTPHCLEEKASPHHVTLTYNTDKMTCARAILEGLLDLRSTPCGRVDEQNEQNYI
jgi:hypothetical protein